MIERGLTDLEYAVLGLISVEPQSGYSIINAFELSPSIRWSASPGSIYPMLKRLEKAGYIDGEIQPVHETRPRKMYRLTPKGEAVFDEWIRETPTNLEVTERRDVMMLKFLFAEKRLTPAEVNAWLDHYDAAITNYLKMFQFSRHPSMAEWSVHQLLIVEMSMMEVAMLRQWIQLARERLNRA